MLTWDLYRKWLGSTLLSGNFPQASCPDISAWSTDTRSITRGEWFVPIVGASYDGHRFIAEALSKGAQGFFYVPDHCADLPQGLLASGIPVRDTLEAFQNIASGWRQSLSNLTLAALTGSSGKTTTKELLGLALKASGNTFATQASFNNEVGVPKTLQQLSPDHVYAAVEFGARMPGNIAFLCELGHPNVAGLLNVGSAHLGIFGSFENLLNTKLEIFRNSPSNAILVPFADDRRILEGALSTGKRILSFGYSKTADVRILDAKWLNATEGMTVDLTYDGKVSHLKFTVAHEMLPQNAAAAMAMALACGAPRARIEEGIVRFQGVKGRYQIHTLEHITLIDDTYNANPASVAAGFQTLRKSFPNRDKILILGDMLELGDDSAAEHHRIGILAAQSLSPSLLVTVGHDAKYIAEGAHSSGMEKSRILSFASVDELLRERLDYASFGDVVYAKGSNGIRLSKVVDAMLEKIGAKR